MRGCMVLLVVMTLPNPGAAAKASRRSGPVAVFGDWMVGCDNVRTCTALVLPSGERQTGQRNNLLRFERAAGPDAAVEHITLSLGNFGPAYPDRAITFRVDGRSVVTAATRDIQEARLPPDALGGSDEAPLRTRFTEREKIVSLLQAMAAGRELTVVSSSGLRQRVSLIGLSAAMRWMDVQQKRNGTVTALIAKGHGAAERVPSPPALPIVHRAAAYREVLNDTEVRWLAEAVRKRRKVDEPGDCNGLNDAEEPASFRASGFAIDARFAVIALRCGIGGAYNHVTALHGVDRVTGEARSLVLEPVGGGAVTRESVEQPGVPIVTNMGFDAPTMVLT